MTPVEVQGALETAVAMLRGGRPYDARALLERTVAQAPKVAEVHRLLGLARLTIRDYEGAEQALRVAAALNRRDADIFGSLGEVQVQLGKLKEAERNFRTALSLDRRNAVGARGMAGLLNGLGRHEEALQVTTPVWQTSRDPAVSAHHAAALKALGRSEDALAPYQRAALLEPASPVHEHNVGAVLADAGRYPEAEAAARRAFAKGGGAAETWLLHAHALVGQDRFDEAQAAYREALKVRPTYLDAQRDLAQLVWTRTEDLSAATAELDKAIGASGDGSLIIVRAQLMANAGDDAGAYDLLNATATGRPSDAGMALAASQQALKAECRGDAVAHAERALALHPGERRAELTLAEALLADGRSEPAQPILDRLHKQTPHDQHILALQAIAWRLAGDPRYGALYDYDAVVRAYTIDTPAGWSNLDAYLADLTEGLGGLHATRTHPLGQSLRHGSQTNQSLLRSTHPAVAAFPQAVDGPIRAHIAALGKGRDPLRIRSRGGYRIAGIWSVRLRPGGFHIDHVHPQGWLSSACYIAVPRAVEGEGREGWIRFGEPGVRGEPPLLAEHYVKPAPGRLVLFPSYMWHGTVPFTGDEARLTVAFDLAPDRKG